jgi:hypothetical protein
LKDALANVGKSTLSKVLGHGPLGATSGPRKEGPLPEKASAVDIAVAEGRQFYCTQFVVWLYNIVSARILNRGRGAILMNDQEAYPGYLAEVLQKRSSNFDYLGSIRGTQNKGNFKKLF